MDFNANMIGFILQRFIHLIPFLMLTAGCILLLIRARSAASLIMLIGNLSMTAVAAFQSLLTVMMINSGMELVAYGRWAMASQIVFFFGGIIFGVGFLIMAFSAKPRFPDQADGQGK